jgi:hypothetical protein
MSTGTEQGPDDGPVVEQQTGAAAGAEGGGDAGDTATEREVGVTAAVERGPAELSSEGDPVPDNPHISLEDREPARSTDEL